MQVEDIDEVDAEEDLIIRGCKMARKKTNKEKIRDLERQFKKAKTTRQKEKILEKIEEIESVVKEHEHLNKKIASKLKKLL